VHTSGHVPSRRRPRRSARPSAPLAPRLLAPSAEDAAPALTQRFRRASDHQAPATPRRAHRATTTTARRRASPEPGVVWAKTLPSRVPGRAVELAVSDTLA